MIKALGSACVVQKVISNMGRFHVDKVIITMDSNNTRIIVDEDKYTGKFGLISCIYEEDGTYRDYNLTDEHWRR